MVCGSPQQRSLLPGISHDEAMKYAADVFSAAVPALEENAVMDDWTHDAITWALTVHEARPGHELQFASLVENGTSLARALFAFNSANVEGWGLYAEKLGVEMGMYATPYDHFGRLSYEMWRACRLVVDTGIHAKGWTRQQAVDYLASNTALSMHEVGTEIDRYIAWPGQALAYKIGELTLWDLRREAEAALGAEFDIREFHDVVLTSGGVPLELLKSMVRQYIDETVAE